MTTSLLAWQKIILPGGNVQLLEQFWAAQATHPAYKKHSIVAKSTFQPAWMVPISIHGDGTPAIGIGKIWCRMLTTWSWTSMVSQSALTKDSQLPIFFLWDETDSGTAEEFFRILAWSLNALQSGLWPKYDFKGKEHLEQMFFVFVLLRFDPLSEHLSKQ